MEQHPNVLAVRAAPAAAGASSALGVAGLAQYPVVWADGGVPQAVFPTTYDELVRVTGGTPIAVA